MEPESAELLALATSIADGAGVDWHEAEVSADESGRTVIRQLRVLAAVADLYRSEATDPLDVASAARGRIIGAIAPAVSQPAVADRQVDQEPSSAETAVDRWGHLTIVEKLGSGTSGDVFRAWDSHLEREVALKILRLAEGSVDSLGERVLNEGRLLARVRHPNVLAVYEAECRDGRVGICMELIRGLTLEQALKEQGPFGAREAVLIGLDLCRALAAVHAAGLVHRDIKAQNVMREKGGRIVLMDFSSGQEVRQPGGRLVASMAGTPLYLAPEVLRGGEATVRSDVYGLGVLIYHLVTGSYPIIGRTMAELWKAHRQSQVKHLRDARPDLPDRFVQVIECALAFEPERRFESVGAMEAALAGALGLDSTSQVPAPPAAPTAEAPSVLHQPEIGARRRRWVAVSVTVASIAALALLAVLAGWKGRPPGERPSSGALAPPTKMMAVLPFDNISGDRTKDYLASAVSLELISRLGQIAGLKVIPWSFMKQYQAMPAKSLGDLAKATGADTVVEGSMQLFPAAGKNTTEPSKLQINVRVFEASTGTLLWTGAFNGDLGGFMRLQGDMTQQIARQIKVKLARREELMLSSGRQVDADAMELYLKGRAAWNERSEAGLNSALEYFNLAIRRDAKFAEAYTGVADSNVLLSAYFGSVDSQEAYRRAIAATTKALEIDSQLADAWSSQAFAEYVLAWNWPKAEAEFKRSLALNPSSAFAHHWYADYLSAIGRHQEALTESRIAEERAPLSPPFSRRVAWSYFFARRYDEAIVQLKKTLVLDPGFVPARTLLGRAYIQKGQYSEGIAELQASGADYQDMLGQAYAAAGRRSEAERILRELTAGAYAHPYGVAQIHAALGNRNEAFAWLERCFRDRDSALVGLKTDPMLDSLRSDPRFDDLLRRMKFPS